MRSLSRYAVLLLAAACFVAMTSGLALYLHLGSHGDLLRHDAKHCSLCHAMTDNRAKFCLESPSAAVYGTDIAVGVEETAELSPHQSVPAVLAPRPPPLFAI